MSEHPCRQLWLEHHPPQGYPAGVLAVPAPIRGTSFFPGGWGLWNPEGSTNLPPFPKGKVMILGQDFHSETGYKASVLRGAESMLQPTWRNLLALLRAAGIGPETCFFTNVFMGLRAGSATTGVFPGATDSHFVAHCRSFLARQLEMQRPNLVVTLGMHAPAILSPLSLELSSWAAAKAIRQLDAAGPVQKNVTFGLVPGFRTTAVALIHPSLRHASLRHRRYGDSSGQEAELRMLLDAVNGKD